ncbi:MAG: methyltransferase domain-containing protein [Rubrobacter sp.]|nr:methyltransferase domain-containing protein [Rubrobacter sp.]
MTDPKERFSGRVENYVRYRPGYPRAVLDLLQSECGLTSGSVVADVASGTGLLAELFLENGNQVYGVEPNTEMRETGERRLDRYDRFTSVAGSAEDTALEAGSVDFVVVGQAFHWFDLDAARAEFVRVLQAGGWVALLWNDMREGATPFMGAYERLIQRYKTEEYKAFDLQGEVRDFFGPGAFDARSFEHWQAFDLDGLQGRLLSSSYVPDAEHPGYDAMMQELYEIFSTHEEGGRVAIEYETLTYYGRLQSL